MRRDRSGGAEKQNSHVRLHDITKSLSANFAGAKARNTKRKDGTSVASLLLGHFEAAFTGEGLAFKLERAQRAIVSGRQVALIFRGKLQALAREQALRGKNCFADQSAVGVEHGSRTFRQRRLGAAVGDPLR